MPSGSKINVKRISSNTENVNQTTDKIQAFEKQQWHLADIEHYGGPVDLRKKHYKFFTETDSGDITGILDLMIEGNVACIENLLVGSEYRKMGIGKNLVETAEEFAKEQKASKIWLETNEGWGAEQFYKKLAYQITGVHEKHIMQQTGLIFTKFF